MLVFDCETIKKAPDEALANNYLVALDRKEELYSGTINHSVRVEMNVVSHNIEVMTFEIVRRYLEENANIEKKGVRVNE